MGTYDIKMIGLDSKLPPDYKRSINKGDCDFYLTTARNKTFLMLLQKGPCRSSNLNKKE